MTQQPGHQDFSTLAGVEKETDVDMAAGIDNADIDEGLSTGSGDQADSVDTVDDLTGTTEQPGEPTS